MRQETKWHVWKIHTCKAFWGLKHETANDEKNKGDCLRSQIVMFYISNMQNFLPKKVFYDTGIFHRGCIHDIELITSKNWPKF